MKILHPILCYYPSQAGGPANTLYWLNAALNPKTYTCSIIATQFGLVEVIDKKIFSSTHTALFFQNKGKTYIKKSLQELKTSHVVQFSSLFFPPTLPILFSAIRKKKTIIMSPRGELYQAALDQKAIKKKVWLSVMKMFQNKIHFHATNDYELGIIQKTFPKAKSTVVIPNFIQMPKKQDLDITKNFVFVGRINPIKNIHILISAIAEVYKTHPDMTLDIVGSARFDYELDYMASLENQVKELELENVITFKGHLNGAAKNKVIAASKALILPSKSENFGNVVLEALAQGTPVIASKNTPWEVLETAIAGFWVDGTIQELTTSILTLLDLNETTYLQMRKNAYALCKSKFDIQTNSHVWENYYQKITTYVQK